MMNFNDAKFYLIEYCNTHLESRKEKTQLRYVCPFCNSGNKANYTASFTIVKNSNGTNYKCFGCGANGDVFNLIQSMDHLESLKQAVARFEQLFDVQIDKRTIKIGTGKKPNKNKLLELYGEHKHRIKLNESDFKLIYDCNKIYYDELQKCDWALKHLHQRGLNDETIKQFQIGYNKKENRIMLPYPKCYSVLKYNPMMQPKYNEIDVNQNDIFNVGVLDNGKPTFVCEGIFDALSVIQCGFNAIALTGTGKTKKLIDYILNNQIKVPLIVMFDVDAETKQNEFVQNLYELKQIAISCNTPSMMKNYHKNIKDPNDCLITKKETFKKLLQRNYDFALSKQNDVKINFALSKK